MTWYQVLCLIGVPSLCTLISTYIVKKLHSHLVENDKKTEAVQLGVQALLRSQLIADWNKWSSKGYAPIYARENFENVYNQYHALGGNGVMEDIYKKFLALPTGKDGN